MLTISLTLAFFTLSFYFFWRMYEACKKVKSYKETWEKVKAGKEEDLFLRILFFRAGGLFDFNYEFSLRTFGDAGMTFMIRALQWMCILMMALTPPTVILLVFIQARAL